jgi:hypothetical protein
MSKETGGPAFPSQKGYIFRTINKENGVPTAEQAELQTVDGMTLRDYFAAKAMQGVLSSGGNLKKEYWPDHKEGRENIAILAYLQADAMLKERNK